MFNFAKNILKMATKRLKAYQDVLNREPKNIEFDGKLSELFGRNVFHIDVMGVHSEMRQN
jgi:hypothetical protein